jgi:hypothetical protein
MKKLITYVGIGALLLSLGCTKKDVEPNINKLEEKMQPANILNQPKETVIQGRPYSAEIVSVGYANTIAIYLNSEGKDILATCDIYLIEGTDNSFNKWENVRTGARAKVILERIIEENKLKNAPEKVVLSGYFDSNDTFICSKLGMRGYEIRLNNYQH